jgi:hypothetical protein
MKRTISLLRTASGEGLQSGAELAVMSGVFLGVFFGVFFGVLFLNRRIS